MTNRKKDVVLADKFTKTTHSHPTPALDPSANKLPKPLNILIIGASHGIGAGIAYTYARAGAANLILAARASSSEELSVVAQEANELKPSVPITCEIVKITSSDSVAELARRVREKVGRLDILVLNSGYSGPVVLKIDEGDPQDFKDVFEVNVQGTYLVAHHFIPLLREGNGAKTFIAVSSFAALIMSGHIANNGYLVEQYGKEGVLAIAVHPGAVLTEMAKQTAPESMMPCSREKRMWLNGRLISAAWDVGDLLEKKGQIEDEDLLKIGFRLGDISAAGLHRP
ncbi:NAD(P)-binding protein [Lizonia empirigonia]|nr:NAD(P)-binding protein [Lizonia empirigonia]